MLHYSNRVLDVYRESERVPGMETLSTVKILADMHRTAFDLDSLISILQLLQHGRLHGQILNILMSSTFFNVPRLPQSLGGFMPDNNANGSASMNISAIPPIDNALNGSTEFNITNFMFDASTDWLGS